MTCSKSVVVEHRGHEVWWKVRMCVGVGSVSSWVPVGGEAAGEAAGEATGGESMVGASVGASTS